MNECKDCIYIKNLEDKIRSLWHEVDDSKKERKELRDKITELERSSDVTQEKLDRLFDAIETIEKTVQRIADTVELLQTKSGRTYEKLAFEVIKYIVLFVLGYFLAKYKL